MSDIMLEANDIRGIIEYLKRCSVLMEDKPKGTFPESDFDGLDQLIDRLDKLLNFKNNY